MYYCFGSIIIFLYIAYCQTSLRYMFITVLSEKTLLLLLLSYAKNDELESREIMLLIMKNEFSIVIQRAEAHK